MALRGAGLSSLAGELDRTGLERREGPKAHLGTGRSGRHEERDEQCDQPSGKAFDLLERLLRERPRAVSLTRLRATLWPDTHVGATSLHVLVSQVRAALEDEAQEPRWIRTVQKFGHAFCGSATGDVEKAGTGGDALWLSSSEGDFRLREGDNVIGREDGLAVRIDRPGVSRGHACIRVAGGRATLTDLGSKNGTFVGDERVSSPRTLRDGDEVRLGLRACVVLERSSGEDTETESR